ncbi:MAG: hypothetical protein CL910_07975 [Deltaproteobacteria bacterium]|nr:hypothetical protein [Deltaproteobacteria bacterium]
MADAIYRKQGDLYVPGEWAGGPWSQEHQHGGPVNALLTRAMAEAAADTGFQPVRITVDLLGPVPLAPLRSEWSFARRSRRMAVVVAALRHEGRDVARATGVLLRATPELEPSWTREDPAPEGPEGLEGVPLMHRAYREEAPPGFHWSLEIRIAPPPDPAAWITTPLDLVEGEPMTPLLRAAAVSDLAFGLAGRTLLKGGYTGVDAHRVMLINTDTTLYFERPPEGAWFGFRHELLADQEGVGLAEVAQFDARGRYGRALQVLLANSRAPSSQ